MGFALEQTMNSMLFNAGGIDMTVYLIVVPAMVLERVSEPSPRLMARIAGVFYLLNILTGSLAIFFAARGHVAWANAVNLAATACYIAVTLLFYEMFKPVSRSLSLIAAFLSLLGCAFGLLGIFHVASFHVNPLVFFGLYCLLIGYLIFRSTFLPRILGVLMAFGGLGWLTFLSPALAKSLSPYNLIPGIFGEGALTVWLLAMAVNERRWREQARVLPSGVGFQGQRP